MKRTTLGICIALAATLLAGCGTNSTTLLTNGGISVDSLGKTGMLSANQKAVTGNITYISISDVFARKRRISSQNHPSQGVSYGGSNLSIPPQYRPPQRGSQ